MPHIARQLGHDVAVPRRGAASMKNLSQRPTEASSGSVTPDRRTAGLEVSLIDGVTLSDGEGRENARGAADLHGFTDLAGACADDADRDDLRAAARVTDAGSCR
jgi:hypothetical protein